MNTSACISACTSVPLLAKDNTPLGGQLTPRTHGSRCNEGSPKRGRGGTHQQLARNQTKGPPHFTTLLPPQLPLVGSYAQRIPCKASSHGCAWCRRAPAWRSSCGGGTIQCERTPALFRTSAVQCVRARMCGPWLPPAPWPAGVHHLLCTGLLDCLVPVRGAVCVLQRRVLVLLAGAWWPSSCPSCAEGVVWLQLFFDKPTVWLVVVGGDSPLLMMRNTRVNTVDRLAWLWCPTHS